MAAPSLLGPFRSLTHPPVYARRNINSRGGSPWALTCHRFHMPWSVPYRFRASAQRLEASLTHRRCRTRCISGGPRTWRRCRRCAPAPSGGRPREVEHHPVFFLKGGAETGCSFNMYVFVAGPKKYGGMGGPPHAQPDVALARAPRGGEVTCGAQSKM